MPSLTHTAAAIVNAD